jgi:hypothetical protein
MQIKSRWHSGHQEQAAMLAKEQAFAAKEQELLAKMKRMEDMLRAHHLDPDSDLPVDRRVYTLRFRQSMNVSRERIQLRFVSIGYGSRNTFPPVLGMVLDFFSYCLFNVVFFCFVFFSKK